jgi:hypothetical protein
VDSVSSASSFSTASRPTSSSAASVSRPTTGDFNAATGIYGEAGTESYSYNADGSGESHTVEDGIASSGGGAGSGKAVSWGLEFNQEASASNFTEDGRAASEATGEEYSNAVALRPNSSQSQYSTGDSTGEQMYHIHYWHVVAKRSLPRKPDGFHLCYTCTRNIAQRYCEDCMLHYCWGCHEETHSCPLGAAQKLKPTRQQLQNPLFLQRMNFYQSHHFVPSKPVKCKLCKTGRALAGIHCNTCEVDMCRTCARRVHDHDSKRRHEFYNI